MGHLLVCGSVGQPAATVSAPVADDLRKAIEGKFQVLAGDHQRRRQTNNSLMDLWTARTSRSNASAGRRAVDETRIDSAARPSDRAAGRGQHGDLMAEAAQAYSRPHALRSTRPNRDLTRSIRERRRLQDIADERRDVRSRSEYVHELASRLRTRKPGTGAAPRALPSTTTSAAPFGSTREPNRCDRARLNLVDQSNQAMG